MHHKYNVLIFMILFSFCSTYSQTYQSSFIAEIAGLSTNTVYIDDRYDKEFISGYGISYSGKFKLSSNYQLELRPGLFFTQEFFHGFQLGLFFRRKLNEQLFGIIGVNTSLNFTGPSHTLSPARSIYTAGITLGSKLSKNYSILLSFYKTLDDISGDSGRGGYTKYLFWLMKLGVEINL